MTAGPLRVVLADDSRLFRSAIAELLSSNGFRIIDQVGDAGSLLSSIDADQPDVAVVDIRMPPEQHLEGLHAAVRIRAAWPGVGLLVLSQHLAVDHLATLVRDGARGLGYLLKDRASETDFLEAVRRVAAGGCVFDPEVVSAMFSEPHGRRRLAVLSAREREVLALMAEGRSNPAIATALCLAAKTVETHVRNIFQRLELPPEAEHDRRVLAVLAYLRPSP